MPVSVRFVGSGDAFGSGGRFQTCILVDGPRSRFAIDFGASSLIALARQGIEHNSIDAVLLTHLHGDHCGGVPFLLMDAMLAAKRQSPLTIAGPPGTRAHLERLGEALFPGMHVMAPRFPLAYVDLQVGQPNRVLDVVVTPRPARHTRETNPTALRVEVGDRVVAYTGDGEWTPDLVEIGRGADLLIAEAYFHSKPVKWHLNYPELSAHLSELNAVRIVLTHMGREMLDRLGDIPEQCAEDGLVIEL